MSLAALRETIDLVVTRPRIWVPGAAAGLLASVILLMAYYDGAFFAARFAILFALAGIWLIAITYALARSGDLTLAGAAKEGAGQYFRVLIPALFITFTIFFIFFLVAGTLTIIGMPADPSVLTFLVFGVMLPTVALTFFADSAAFFEGKKVFESVHRSIEVVTSSLFETMLFYIGSFLIACIVGFIFFVGWTAALADKLEPVTHFNETMYATFTPDDLLSLIGTDGVWLAAACVFGTVMILFTILVTYKACFFRAVSGTTLPIRQVTGEYDSKGRWYKY